MGKVIDDYEEFVRQSEKLIDDEGGDVMEENKFDINDAYEQVERADKVVEKLASEMLRDSAAGAKRNSIFSVLLLCALIITNGMWAVAWFVGEEVVDTTTTVTETIEDIKFDGENTNSNFNIGIGDNNNYGGENRKDIEDDNDENEDDPQGQEEEVKEKVE